MLMTRIIEDREALFLAIENLGPITLAYGDDVARVVADQVRHCAHAFFDGNVELQPLSPSIFTIDGGEDESGLDRLAIDELCALISAMPFHVMGTSVMVVVSLHEQMDSAQAACSQHSVTISDEWLVGYRRDMALASQFVKLTNSGNLLTLWRPVRSTRRPDVVLHYEAVPRLLGPNGQYRECTAEYEALERLGMIWVYDRANLMAALDELAADARPSIAVQISAHSLRQNHAAYAGRWLAALRRLQASPDIASRLTIEISGTFAGTSVESIRDSIAAFRRLGVSLAVANFASSDMNFGALVTLDPDIVKISPAFLHAAAVDPANCRRLQLLFKLAGTMSRTVVVEGVDHERHMHITRVLGADWITGQCVGAPSFGRHWKIVEALRSVAVPANEEDDSVPALRGSGS